MNDGLDIPPAAPTQAIGAESSASLARRSVIALKWSYLGVAARIAMQLVAQIVLARLLGPDAFGVVAASTLILAMSSLITELGLGAAIVQSRELSVLNVRSAFTKVLVSSSIAALALYFLAGWAAVLFGNPAVEQILRWMLPAFMFQASGVVSLGLLKRKLDFKSIQIAQTTSYFFGFLVAGVGSALLGIGVWSLVVAWTVQNVLATALFFSQARHEILPVWRGTSPSMHRFGFGVMLTNVANWVIENIDNLVIGKVFGTQALGNYAVAYNLVRTPANHAVSSIQQVLFPASARAQAKPEAVAVAYLAAIWAVGMVTFPIFVGVGVVADTVVAALYGSKWDQAAVLLLPLALAMPLHAVMAIAGPMLWGRGEVGREFAVQSWVAVLLVVATVGAAMWSAVAVAWAVLLVYLVRAVWLHSKVAVSLGVPFCRVLVVLSSGVGVATLTGLLLFGCDAALRMRGLPPLARLLMEIMAAAAALAVVLYTAIGVLLPYELRPFISNIANRLPCPIASILRRRVPA